MYFLKRRRWSCSKGLVNQMALVKCHMKRCAHKIGRVHLCHDLICQPDDVASNQDDKSLTTSQNCRTAALNSLGGIHKVQANLFGNDFRSFWSRIYGAFIDCSLSMLPKQ